MSEAITSRKRDLAADYCSKCRRRRFGASLAMNFFRKTCTLEAGISASAGFLVASTNNIRFLQWPSPLTVFFYTANAKGGQDEPNPTFLFITYIQTYILLTNRADKMALPCPLEITRWGPQYNNSFINHVYSVKMDWCWPPRSVFFCVCVHELSAHKHTTVADQDLEPGGGGGGEGRLIYLPYWLFPLLSFLLLPKIRWVGVVEASPISASVQKEPRYLDFTLVLGTWYVH